MEEAGERGLHNEDCAQYYCPPSLPEFFETQSGDQYAPPPTEYSDEPSSTENYFKRSALKTNVADPLSNEVVFKESALQQPIGDPFASADVVKKLPDHEYFNSPLLSGVSVSNLHSQVQGGVKLTDGHSQDYETKGADVPSDASTQRLTPVTAPQVLHSTEPITLQKLIGMPPNENFVNEGSFSTVINEAGVSNVRIYSASTETSNINDVNDKFYNKIDSVKKITPSTIQFVNAPKISTIKYSKVKVDPTTEAQTPLPQVVTLKLVNRQNSELVFPLKLREGGTPAGTTLNSRTTPSII